MKRKRIFKIETDIYDFVFTKRDGLDCLLLYYTDFLYATKGFDRVHMNYQNILFNAELPIENKLAKVREYVWGQVKDVNFAVYDEIVFLSKSSDSVEAGILA